MQEANVTFDITVPTEDAGLIIESLMETAKDQLQQAIYTIQEKPNFSDDVPVETPEERLQKTETQLLKSWVILKQALGSLHGLNEHLKSQELQGEPKEPTAEDYKAAVE